jgi:hypothetical protein
MDRSQLADFLRTRREDETAYTGPDRSMVYRWFTRPGTRQIYPGEDHDMHSRAFTADLRSAVARHGPRLGGPTARAQA